MVQAVADFPLPVVKTMQDGEFLQSFPPSHVPPPAAPLWGPMGLQKANDWVDWTPEQI